MIKRILSFPDALALPENSEQVRELLRYARDNNIDVIPYGGGTSVVGHINPEISPRPILTIDMSTMNKLLHFDRESQLATFGAGTPGPEVEAQLQKEGYTLGHFPQSWELVFRDFSIFFNTTYAISCILELDMFWCQLKVDPGLRSIY